MDDDENDGGNSEDPILVRIERYRQTGRTVRTLFICGCICFCFYRLCLAVVAVMDQPAWLTLLLALIAPSGLLWMIIASIRRYTKRTVGRTAELEKIVDPERTSSGLLSDGQSPPQDKP